MSTPAEPVPAVAQAVAQSTPRPRVRGVRARSERSLIRGALEKLAPHRERTELASDRAGYVTKIDSTALGLAARALVEGIQVVLAHKVSCRSWRSFRRAYSRKDEKLAASQGT